MTLRCHFPFSNFFISLQLFLLFFTISLLPFTSFLLSFTIFFLLPFRRFFNFPPLFFYLPSYVFLLPFTFFFWFPLDFFYFPSLFFTSLQHIFDFPSPFFVLLFGIFPPSVFLLPSVFLNYPLEICFKETLKLFA